MLVINFYGHRNRQTRNLCLYFNVQIIAYFVPLKVCLLSTVKLINILEEDLFLSGESELP